MSWRTKSAADPRKVIEKRSIYAAVFRAFRPLSQPAARFRQNVWQSGVLKTSGESYEFLARRARGVGVNESDSATESRVLSRSPHNGTGWSSKSSTSRRCHPDPLTCRRRVYSRAQLWRRLESVAADHPCDRAHERRRARHWSAPGWGGGRIAR